MNSMVKNDRKIFMISFENTGPYAFTVSFQIAMKISFHSNHVFKVLQTTPAFDQMLEN